MATTVTGKAIRQTLITAIGGIGYIGQQVGAGGSSTTLVDTVNFKGRALPPSMFDNGIVRVTSGTRAGERTYIDYLDPSTGTIYLDGGLTGALADGDEYEVWLRGVDPDFVDRLRDDCLDRLCSTWRPQPFTVVPDGDLEAVGVTSWTAIAGATRTKALGAAPDIKSRWQLSVVHTTASTDFVESANIDCQPSEIYYLEVPLRAYVTATSAAATASIDVRDVTNTASISIGGIRTSHVGRGWGRLALFFQIPANCFQFKLRLKSDTNASTTEWGGFACTHRDATEITLPDRIRTKKRVGHTFWTTQIVPYTGWVNNTRYKLRQYRNVERVQMGSNVLIMVTPGFGNNAVYYYERGYFSRLQTSYVTTAQRLAGDAATTDCPLEYVGAVLAEQVAKRMLDKYGAEWQDDWVRAATWSNYWEGEFGPEPQHIFENTQSVYVPDIRV